MPRARVARALRRGAPRRPRRLRVASGSLQAVYRRPGGSGLGPVEYGDLHIVAVPAAGAVTVVKRRDGP